MRLAKSFSIKQMLVPQRNLLLLSLITFLSMTLLPSEQSRVFGQDDEQEIPAPERVSLDTKDGVLLKAVYYQGLGEKKSIPIIMVHDWDRSGEDFAYLAAEMQKLGHSVIVPDLRGHGGSVRVRGVDKEIDRERMTKVEIASIASDLEACKSYLREMNNEGKLNIDMLSIVAAGDLCVVAAEWAISDWRNWPELVGKRQGQDVKSLVLLSPSRTFKGLTLTRAMRDGLFSGRGAKPFSVMMAVGNGERRALQDSKTLYNMMERTRPKLDLDDKSAEERSRIIAEDQDLFLWEYEVDYQGGALVHPGAIREDGVDVVRKIGLFFYYRILAKESNFPWEDRS